MTDNSGKYYWLKLKRDFFKRHDIRIIEGMPNGKDYILFYLKLLCESVDHEGSLRFSDQIPYNDEMLSVITNTNIDIVRSAVKVFSSLNMMEVFDDGTIFMNEVQKMLGSASNNSNALRQARFRERKKEEALCERYGSVTENNESKREESELDIEKEKREKSKKEELTLSDDKVCRTKDVRRIVDAWNTLGLNKLRDIKPDTKRGAMTRKRVNDYGVDTVLEAIECVRRSKFLNGDNKNGWVVTYDWFIGPQNFQKVLEGNYDDRAVKRGGSSFMDMWKEYENGKDGCIEVVDAS